MVQFGLCQNKEEKIMSLNPIQRQVLDVFMEPMMGELRQRIQHMPIDAYAFYYSLLGLCEADLRPFHIVRLPGHSFLGPVKIVENGLDLNSYQYLSRAGLLDFHRQIAKIFKHPCPQNRSTSFSEGHLSEPEVEFQVYDEGGKFLRIDKEQAGLLSLTNLSRDHETVTKQDVVHYLIRKLQEAMCLLPCLSDEIDLERMIDEENILGLEKVFSTHPANLYFLTKKDPMGYVLIKLPVPMESCGFEPVHFYIARHAKLAVAKWLFPKIPQDFIFAEYNRKNVVNMSILSGNTEFFRWLLEAYPEINSRLHQDTAFTNEIFFHAATYKNLGLVTTLLSQFSSSIVHHNLDSETHSNFTYLHLLIGSFITLISIGDSDHIKIIELLLLAGADVNVIDVTDEINTVLDKVEEAIQKEGPGKTGEESILKLLSLKDLLSRFGAKHAHEIEPEINVKRIVVAAKRSFHHSNATMRDLPPLATYGEHALVMLAGSRDLYFTDTEYRSPEKSIACLLDLGVPVDGRDVHGSTALIEASKLKQLKTIKFLLEQGADPLITDRRGLTAHDYFPECELLSVMERSTCCCIS